MTKWMTLFAMAALGSVGCYGAAEEDAPEAAGVQEARVGTRVLHPVDAGMWTCGAQANQTLVIQVTPTCRITYRNKSCAWDPAGVCLCTQEVEALAGNCAGVPADHGPLIPHD